MQILWNLLSSSQQVKSGGSSCTQTKVCRSVWPFDTQPCIQANEFSCSLPDSWFSVLYDTKALIDTKLSFCKNPVLALLFFCPILLIMAMLFFMLAESEKEPISILLVSGQTLRLLWPLFITQEFAFLLWQNSKQTPPRTRKIIYCIFFIQSVRSWLNMLKYFSAHSKSITSVEIRVYRSSVLSGWTYVWSMVSNY